MRVCATLSMHLVHREVSGVLADLRSQDSKVFRRTRYVETTAATSFLTAPAALGGLNDVQHRRYKCHIAWVDTHENVSIIASVVRIKTDPVRIRLKS